jgi:undecaprenyl-diphosphatase
MSFSFARLRTPFAKLGRFGWDDVLLLLLVFGLLAMAYGFIELADEVMDGDTQTLDERVLLSLRRADDPAVPIAHCG